MIAQLFLEIGWHYRHGVADSFAFASAMDFDAGLDDDCDEDGDFDPRDAMTSTSLDAYSLGEKQQLHSQNPLGRSGDLSVSDPWQNVDCWVGRREFCDAS